jgi:hypothetical protein
VQLFRLADDAGAFSFTAVHHAWNLSGFAEILGADIGRPLVHGKSDLLLHSWHRVGIPAAPVNVSAKNLRKAGEVRGVVYGSKTESTSIVCKTKELHNVYMKAGEKRSRPAR